MAHSIISLKRMFRFLLYLCIMSLIYFFSDSAAGQLKLKTDLLANNQQKQNNGSLANIQQKVNISVKLNKTIDKSSTADNNATYEIDDKDSNHSQANTGHTSKARATSNELKRNDTFTIGILIPSTTQNVKNPALEKLSLTTLCLPSLYKTFEKKYLYQIYIGIDKGDYLETVQNELKRLFSNITVVTEVSSKKTFTRSVNAIARKAYEDGVDYFVRINDDTSFETKNWTSFALDILLKYTPPNIGVVGPTCKNGLNRILTHDMVHRTHFEIFGFYYPMHFDNWWTDDWITRVYEPERSTQIAPWIVKHHVRFHGRRYKIKKKQFAQFKKIVSNDRERVAEYLKKTRNSDSV